MTSEEKGIMEDIYYLLRDYGDPPAINAASCEDFWYKAGKELTALVGTKWKNHPLATKLGLALFTYIENKSKEAGDGVLQKQ